MLHVWDFGGFRHRIFDTYDDCLYSIIVIRDMMTPGEVREIREMADLHPDHRAGAAEMLVNLGMRIE